LTHQARGSRVVTGSPESGTPLATVSSRCAPAFSVDRAPRVERFSKFAMGSTWISAMTEGEIVSGASRLRQCANSAGSPARVPRVEALLTGVSNASHDCEHSPTELRGGETCEAAEIALAGIRLEIRKPRATNS